MQTVQVFPHTSCTPKSTFTQSQNKAAINQDWTINSAAVTAKHKGDNEEQHSDQKWL